MGLLFDLLGGLGRLIKALYKVFEGDLSSPVKHMHGSLCLPILMLGEVYHPALLHAADVTCP